MLGIVPRSIVDLPLSALPAISPAFGIYADPALNLWVLPVCAT